MTYLDKNSYKNATSKGLCVVILGAPWCKDCIALKPILERVIPAYADRINFFGVNFDDDDTEIKKREEIALNESISVVVECADDEEAETIFEKLSEEGYKCHISTL